MNIAGGQTDGETTADYPSKKSRIDDAILQTSSYLVGSPADLSHQTTLSPSHESAGRRAQPDFPQVPEGQFQTVGVEYPTEESYDELDLEIDEDVLSPLDDEPNLGTGGTSLPVRVTDHQLTPATKALSFLPTTVQPAGTFPTRPFIFYENVLGKNTGYLKNWALMERELFGIKMEEIDSATVSACHRFRGYITNIPTATRVLHPSNYMQIGDVFKSLDYWPDWDRRKVTGKLLTVRSKRAPPNFCNKVKAAMETDGGQILDAKLKKEVRPCPFTDFKTRFGCPGSSI